MGNFGDLFKKKTNYEGFSSKKSAGKREYKIDF